MMTWEETIEKMRELKNEIDNFDCKAIKCEDCIFNLIGKHNTVCLIRLMIEMM